MPRDKAPIELLFNEFYRLVESSDVISVHDIYLRIDDSENKVYISDESGTVSYGWKIDFSDYDDLDDLLTHIVEALSDLKDKAYFDRPLFDQPLSVLYVNEEQEVIRELLLVDDEWVRLDDPLMKDLDQELDEFFTQLMQDNS